MLALRALSGPVRRAGVENMWVCSTELSVRVGDCDQETDVMAADWLGWEPGRRRLQEHLWGRTLNPLWRMGSLPEPCTFS